MQESSLITGWRRRQLAGFRMSTDWPQKSLLLPLGKPISIPLAMSGSTLGANEFRSLIGTRPSLVSSLGLQ